MSAVTVPYWYKPPPSVDELVTDDGEPMETGRHVQQMLLLIDSLNHGWAHRDDFFVGGNMFLYFSALQVKKNDFRGPDVFVVMGTERRERKAWVVWEEDGRVPDVVVELTSPSTEAVDRGEKMRVYGQVLHVPEYVIFDPFAGTLEGWEWDSTSYRPVPLDRGGRLPSRKTGLTLGTCMSTYLGLELPWLRWFGPDGVVLPTGSESNLASQARAARAEESARQAEERLREERARSEALARRLAELEAKGTDPR
jgi:Uma2 family endonuclease